MEKECIVITNPMIAANKSAQVTLSKFLRVISACYDRITVIGGNITVDSDLEQINVVSVPIQRSPGKIKRALDIFLLQVKMARYTVKYTKKKLPVYFWTGDKMLIPYWAAHSRKGDIRYFLYGNVTKEGSPSRFRQLSGKLIAYMANHANSICVESPGVLREWEGMITPREPRVIHLYTNAEGVSCDRRPDQRIGMLCRLTEGKHVLESIRTFAEFHKTHGDYSLEIIGSGKQEQVCKELIEALDAQSYIHMLGWIDHENVMKKTASWQYLLFPTDTEGMPNSVIEMMSMGIPVIASPVGGIPDIIDHGRNGWLMKGSGEEDILSALHDAVSCTENYQSMSAAARKEIGHKFSLENAQITAKNSV